jgi:1,4-dihydroxy-2-naphthoyl-CoA hydrolase
MTIDREATDRIQTTMPFAKLLAIQIVERNTERVVATADWKAEYCTGNGVMHGGYLMSIADTIGATCAGQYLPEKSFTTTIESKTNLFRPVTEGSVTITATPVHTGRRTIVVQTDVTNAAGKLVSRTTQTQAVIPIG